MIQKTFGLFFANVVSLIHYPITVVEKARIRDREKCHPPFPLPRSYWGSLTDARLTVPVPKHARVERMNGLSTLSFHASAPSMLYPKSIDYPNISSGSMG